LPTPANANLSRRIESARRAEVADERCSPLPVSTGSIISVVPKDADVSLFAAVWLKSVALVSRRA
jgi:hypothetical protein